MMRTLLWDSHIDCALNSTEVLYIDRHIYIYVGRYYATCHMCRPEWPWLHEQVNQHVCLDPLMTPNYAAGTQEL